MAQLALGLGGAAVGSLFGMPALGYSIGASLGSYVSQNGQTVKGPRLSDLRVQTASQGAPLPKPWGTVPLAGAIQWSTGLIESASTQSTGGKGAPSQKVKTFSYTSSFSIAICEGPISGIRKIWADGKLIYDTSAAASPTTQAVTNTTAGFMTVYLGTAAQTADPTIEAEVGSGNAPAFRGLAHVVFADYPLADYGNRIPNFTFEIVEDGTSEDESVTFRNPKIFASWGSMEADHPMPSNFIWPWNTYFEFQYQSSPASPVRTTLSAALADASADGHDPSYLQETFSGAIGFATDSALDFNNKVGSGLSKTDDSESFYVILNYRPDQYHETGDNVSCEDIGSVSGPNDERHWGDFSGGGLSNAVFFAAGHPFSPPDLFYNQTYVNNCTLGGAPNEDNWFGMVGNPSAVIKVTRIKSCPQGVCDDYPLPENTAFCVDEETGDISPNWTFAEVEDMDAFLQLQVEDTDAGGYSQYPQWVRTGDPFEDNPSVIPVGDARDTEAYWTALAGEAGAAGVTIAGSYTATRPNSNPALYPVTVSEICSSSFERSTTTPNLVPLSTIVQEICIEAGLSASDIDVTDLASVNVYGYVKTRPMSAREALQPLAQIYFFDGIESEGKIKFVRRGAAPVTTVVEGHLATHAEGEQRPEPLAITRMQETELPRVVRIHYLNPLTDYEDDVQGSSRQITQSKTVVDIEAPIVLYPSQAAIIADKLLYEAWIARFPYEFTLPRDYNYLDPVDSILIPYEGATHRVRITSMEYDGYIRFRGVSEDIPIYSNLTDDLDDSAYSYSSTNPGGSGNSSATTGDDLAGPSILNIYDLPALDFDADNPGFYFGVYGPLSGWAGASLQRSLDDEVSWDDIDDADTKPTYGTTVDALADAGTFVIDKGSTVEVSLNNGSLSSITEAQLIAGGNLCAIGVAGSWELLQFQTVELTSDGTYILSDLLRGRFGTEQFTDDHAIGDRFVLINAAVERYPSAISRIGVAGDYRAVSYGTPQQGATSQEFTPGAVGLKPLQPVHVVAEYNSNDDIELVWVRRDRLDYGWRDGVGLENSEANESYEIDVYEGATFIETLETTAPLASYTAAEYNAATGSSISDLTEVTLTFTIYQISSVVGRGFGAEVTK